MQDSLIMKLIITVITVEKTDLVFAALEKEGICKSTIIRGRGKSDRNPRLLLDLVIEPQRDIILTIVAENKANEVFDTIMKVGQLDLPSHGVVFIIDLEKAGGLDLPL